MNVGFPNHANCYRPIHFKLEELVPANIYAARGERSIELLDWRIVYSLDCIREFLDIPLTVNTWLWQGQTQYRGFRPPNSESSQGAPLSQHKFGRAIDFVSKKMSAEDMRQKIVQANRLFPYITYMEDEVNWVHIDCRQSDKRGIHLFKP